MDAIRLAICMKDTEYERALAVAIAARHHNIIVSHLESEGASLHIETDPPKSISGKVEVDTVGLLVHGDLLLSDDDFKAKEWGSKFIFLEKHVPVGQLCRNIISRYSELTGRVVIKKGKADTQVIYIGSGAGGVGVTSIAVGVAVTLQRFENKKVCFLSLEEITDSRIFFEENENARNVTHLLYGIIAKDNAIIQLEDYLVYDRYGTAAINMPKGQNPLSMQKAEELNRLLEFLCEKGGFDYIVCDGGSSIKNPALAYMEAADIAVFVCSEKPSYKEKIFDEFLVLKFHSKEECVIKVKNLCEGDVFKHLHDDETIVVEKDESSFVTGKKGIDVSLDKGFGTGIKELCKKIQGKAGEKRYGRTFTGMAK